MHVTIIFFNNSRHDFNVFAIIQFGSNQIMRTRFGESNFIWKNFVIIITSLIYDKNWNTEQSEEELQI